jgi:hypothetical protein
VIAQVAGKVADAQLPRTPHRRKRRRLAIDAARRRIVGEREPIQELGLDIEEQQQVEQLLQRIGELELVGRLETFVAQPFEIAVEPAEFAEALADLERVHGDRQRVRTLRLEALEVRPPAVNAAGGEQRLAQVLVGGHVARLVLDHMREGSDRRVAVACGVEQHAEIEMSRGEIGAERKRPLIGARCVGAAPYHLQRDAVVVVRFAVLRFAFERRFKVRGGALAVTRSEPRRSPRAQQRCRRIVG